MRVADPPRKKMTTKSKRKKALATKMADYFVDRGNIPSRKEFSIDPLRPRLVKSATIKRVFGSWSLMEDYTKSFCADKLAVLAQEKPNALEALKAKAAVAETEGANGENI